MAAVGVLLFLVAAAHFSPSSSTTSYWDFSCAGGNFTPGSLYANNLNAVAAVLPGLTASSPLLFYSSEGEASTGAAGSPGHGKTATVYAVVQCQRDSRRHACKRCVTKALNNARQFCVLKVGAIIFHDECTVAYYNTSLDILPFDPSIHVIATRTDNVDVTIHSKVFEDSVHELAQAVMNRTVTSSQYFVTGVKTMDTVDYSLKLYGVAQCLPSLLHEECDLCLQGELMLAMNTSADDLIAGRRATLWCSYRFGLHPFFSGSPTLILAPYQTFGDVKPDGSKHKKTHKVLWISIAVGVAAVVGVVIALIILYCRKKRLSKQNQPKGEPSQTRELTDMEGEEAARHTDSGLVVTDRDHQDQMNQLQRDHQDQMNQLQTEIESLKRSAQANETSAKWLNSQLAEAEAAVKHYEEDAMQARVHKELAEKKLEWVRSIHEGDEATMDDLYADLKEKNAQLKELQTAARVLLDTIAHEAEEDTPLLERMKAAARRLQEDYVKATMTKTSHEEATEERSMERKTEEL